MKKIAIISIFILSVTSVFSQVKSYIKVYVNDQKTVTEKVDNLVFTELKISANEEQIKNMKKSSNGFSQFSAFTFSETPDAQGLYSITIKSKPHKDAETDKQFLIKILTKFKVDAFVYKGKTFPLNEFAKEVK